MLGVMHSKTFFSRRRAGPVEVAYQARGSILCGASGSSKMNLSALQRVPQSVTSIPFAVFLFCTLLFSAV